jgi:hypothetical protein
MCKPRTRPMKCSLPTEQQPVCPDVVALPIRQVRCDVARPFRRRCTRAGPTARDEGKLELAILPRELAGLSAGEADDAQVGMRADFRVRPGVPDTGFAAELAADDNLAGLLIDHVPVEPLVSRAALANVVDARAGPNANGCPGTQARVLRAIRANEIDNRVALCNLDKTRLVSSAAVLNRLAIDQFGKSRC